MCNAWCKDFVEKTVTHWPTRPDVLEVGARNVNGSVRDILAPLVSRYVGCDLEAGEGVDVVADATRLTDAFAPDTFDVVISTEMLEHVPDWPAAWAEMLRVLRVGGLLILSTRSPGFPVHNFPGDFWRFTAKDLYDILDGVADVLLIDHDKTLGYPCGIGVVARKLDAVDWQAWQARQSGTVHLYHVQACARLTVAAFKAGIPESGPLAPLRDRIIDLEQKAFDAQIAAANARHAENRLAEAEIQLARADAQIQGAADEQARAYARILALEGSLHAWHCSVFGRLARLADHLWGIATLPWRAGRCLANPVLRQRMINHLERRWLEMGGRRRVGEMPELDWVLDTLDLGLSAAQVKARLGSCLTRREEAEYRKMIGPLRRMGLGVPATVVRPASLAPADATSSVRRRILFVCGEFPNPVHGGGGRVFDFIKTLSANHDVYVAAWYVRSRDHKVYAEIAPYCRGLLGLSFEDLEGGCSAKLMKLIGDRPVDVVHYEWPRALNSFDRRLGRKHIYTHMEVVSCSLWMDLVRLEPLSRAWLQRFIQLLAMLRVEVLDAAKADAQVVVTAKDGAFLSRFVAGQAYHVVNHGIDRTEFTVMDRPPEPNTLVFTGNFSHYPNVDAVEHFMREIFPAVATAVPDVRVWLVGANPPDSVKRFQEDARVRVTGYVDDIRPFIQKACVCIAPLISGAGLRTKVVQYAALRRPSVVTPIAAEDLLFEAETEICIADKPAAFAAQVVTLLRDPALAAKIAERARVRAVREYDNAAIAERSLNGLYHLLDQAGEAVCA